MCERERKREREREREREEREREREREREKERDYQVDPQILDSLTGLLEASNDPPLFFSFQIAVSNINK